MTKQLITIGQLAAYAGVTIKAVRHYHRRGLLEEPSRDSSGYRRYTAEHAIALVKIRTLAEAGVPLARIKELLAAEPDRFAAAIREIDRNLQERTRELRRTRERIARLSAGDRLFVSTEVADLLDQLHELGVSQRLVQTRSAIRSSVPFTSSTTRRSTGLRTTRASTRWPAAPSGGSPRGRVGSRADRGRRSRTRPSPSWPHRRSAPRRRPGTGSPRSPGSASGRVKGVAPPQPRP